MALDSIAGRLLGLEIFRGLAPAQVERIAREAERMIFRDGQTLVAAGTEGDGALVIIAGRAMALADADTGRSARQIEPGSMIGELAMLTEHHIGVTVVADGDVRAIKVVRETLHANMQEDPALAAHLHARLVARLQRVALELRMIDERLAAAGGQAGDLLQRA